MDSGNKRVRPCNNTIETESTLCSRNGPSAGLLRQAQDRSITVESTGRFFIVDKPYKKMLNMDDRSISQDPRRLRDRLSDDRNAQNLFKGFLGKRKNRKIGPPDPLF